MRALIQRVSMSRVRVDDITVGEIEQGLLVLLGVAPDDTIADRDWLLRKILNLRIFADEEGRMNRSVTNIQGGLLVISQFTIFADAAREIALRLCARLPLNLLNQHTTIFLRNSAKIIVVLYPQGVLLQICRLNSSTMDRSPCYWIPNRRTSDWIATKEGACCLLQVDISRLLKLEFYRKSEC